MVAELLTQTNIFALLCQHMYDSLRNTETIYYISKTLLYTGTLSPAIFSFSKCWIYAVSSFSYVCS